MMFLMSLLIGELSKIPMLNTSIITPSMVRFSINLMLSMTLRAILSSLVIIGLSPK